MGPGGAGYKTGDNENEHLNEDTVVSEHKSFCRICTGHCGVVASVDAAGRLLAIRGDRDDPQTLGFICSKGTDAVDSHNSAERIPRPLKRQPDGSFAPIPLEQALAEIADRLRAIVERDGPNAVAAYRGSGGFMASASIPMVNGFLEALGSHQMYSNLTIDQSAKWVAIGRVGWWPPGTQAFGDSDVSMLVGNNPLVSIAGSGMDTRHPLKRLRDAKARGMKLIVIDPRRSETAEYADLHIQPLPGNDAAILAAILKVILAEGWHDREFCAQHVAGLDQLRAALAPFDGARVARLADIPARSIREAAELFARDGRRGTVATGTGPSMSPHSNLMEHLVSCINAVCGRYIRAGEPIPNPGLVLGWTPKRAQVVDVGRSWERGPKSRSGGFGTIGGEMLTALLADEILTPGPDRIRCLFSVGGNPAAAVPDQDKMVGALEDLELLVCLEPFMTATAALADYILPPFMAYERADLHLPLFETAIYPEPYGRHTHPVAAPPADAELCAEWFVFWSLASRLGLALVYHGEPLDMASPPTTDQLLALFARGAPVPWETLRDAELGYRHPETLVALPADPATAGRFTLLPDDVAGEIAELERDAEVLEAGQGSDDAFPFRLCSRRNRHRFNTVGHHSPYLRKLVPYNPAYLNPADMAALGLRAGDWVEIRSDQGAIRARVAEDGAVRTGVVSMSHCFGYLPGNQDYDTHGASTNRLISTERDLQTINAMPRMSGIPVSLQPLAS